MDIEQFYDEFETLKYKIEEYCHDFKPPRPIEIKVKKLHPDAVLPKNAHPTDSGYDIVAVDDGQLVEQDENGWGRCIEYRTGIAIQPPDGYHTLIHPRSSVSKYDLVLCNSIGLVDGTYRGELVCRFKLLQPFSIQISSDSHLAPGEHERKTCWMDSCSFSPHLYKKGDKIAQLVIEKTEPATFIEVKELEDTARGSGGFGSTDKKKG